MTNPILVTNCDEVKEYNDIEITSEKKFKTSEFNSEGVFVNMPKVNNITINESGEYHFLSGNKNIIINIKSGIEVSIIERSKKKIDTNYSNTKIIVGENSIVDYLVIDSFKKAFNLKQINVLKDAKFNLSVVGFNTAYNENKITIDLDEEGSESNLKIITVASDSAHSVYETRINNNAPQTKADIWQKAVVKSSGSNDFITTGFIKKGADDASNYQESRVLLLDDAGLGNTSPLLLIDHYNVVAGHAAGVSRVNEDDLYYLQTRGINKKEAEKLMTIAFVKPLIDLIKDEEIKEGILKYINNLV